MYQNVSGKSIENQELILRAVSIFKFKLLTLLMSLFAKWLKFTVLFRAKLRALYQVEQHEEVVLRVCVCVCVCVCVRVCVYVCVCMCVYFNHCVIRI